MPTEQENIAIVEYIAGDLEFEVKYIQPWHLRLTPAKGRSLDYFPKSGRATWVSSGKWFEIEDIEKFIYDNWKINEPSAPGHIK
jgi:hypothetical protein